MEGPRVTRLTNGLWQISDPRGDAAALTAALDPELDFVLIETWDGVPGWHEALVAFGADDEPRPRLVRHHRFDVLVTPSEAADIGRRLGARREGSGLGCWQFRQRPKAEFRLPDYSQGRADAMVGLGVELEIDLPHEGEVAVITSPIRSALERYAQRLCDGAGSDAS